MKKIIFLVVLVVIVGGVVLLLSSSGDLIKVSVEKYGPEVTGGQVSLASADVSILGGSLSLGGLVIGNPAGFQTPNAFTLDEISIDMDMDSLMEDAIHIQNILIESPVITYEQKGRSSNIDALQENIERNIGMSEDTGAEEESVALIIDELLIRNAELNVILDIGDGSTTTVILPEVRLTRLGEPGRTVDPAEAATAVMNAITPYIAEAIASDQIQNLLDSSFGDSEGVVDKIGSGLKGLFDKD